MKNIILAAALAVVSLVVGGSAWACTQEEATAKIGKIYQSPEYQAMTANAKTPEDSAKIVAINQKVNDAGKLLAEQKHDDACAKYDEVMEELGIK